MEDIISCLTVISKARDGLTIQFLVVILGQYTKTQRKLAKLVMVCICKPSYGTLTFLKNDFKIIILEMYFTGPVEDCVMRRH